MEKASTLTPLWGICLGFQWLLQMASEDIHLLSTGFDSENISLPLTFTEAGETSRMYTQNGAIDMVSLLKANNVTMNNHGAGVKPTNFASHETLDDFNLLSTNKDRNGLEVRRIKASNKANDYLLFISSLRILYRVASQFVSSFEHKNFPIYGTQYHPEKSNFEVRQKNKACAHSYFRSRRTSS